MKCSFSKLDSMQLKLSMFDGSEFATLPGRLVFSFCSIILIFSTARSYDSSVLPLSIKALYPDIDVITFDINPHQITHVIKKIKAIKSMELDELNVGSKNDICLNQSGKF